MAVNVISYLVENVLPLLIALRLNTVLTLDAEP